MSKTEKPLKILQVVSTPPFAWDTGGCARVVYDLSVELAKKGHIVTILTTDLFKPDKRYKIKKNPEIVNGVKIVRFNCLFDRLAWKYKIYLSPGMIKYIKNNVRKYDVVHLQDLISIQAYYTSKYCKYYNIPYVLTAHGSLEWLRKSSLLNKLYGKFFGDYILKNAKKCIALNEIEMDLYKKFGIENEKIELIPNGIDFNQYKSLPLKGTFRKKYNILANKRIILYLGRIHKTKGIELLIKAYNLVNDVLDNVILIIIGPDDGYLKNLKHLAIKLGIHEKILFLGPLYEIEKFEAYADANIFVTPSFTGFPLTFLEASICNTPIITTDLNENLTWINSNIGIVTKFNEKELKDAMIRILENPEKFNKFNKDFLEKNFSWQYIIPKFEEIYYINE